MTIHTESWYRKAQAEEQLQRLDAEVLRNPDNLDAAERLWSLLRRSGELRDEDLEKWLLAHGPRSKYQSLKRHPNTYMLVLARRANAGITNRAEEVAMWLMALDTKSLPPVSKQVARSTGHVMIFEMAIRQVRLDEVNRIISNYYINPRDPAAILYDASLDGPPTRGIASPVTIQTLLRLLGSTSFVSRIPPQFRYLSPQQGRRANYFFYIYWVGASLGPEEEVLAQLEEWV